MSGKYCPTFVLSQVAPGDLGALGLFNRNADLEQLYSVRDSE